jgi:Rap1a immunity proteins
MTGRVKMVRSALLAAAALALTVTAAGAEEDIYSANHMMQGCRAFIRSPSAESFLAGRCAGVIEAIGYADASVCSPKGVTTGQAARVVAAYIDARPARMHENFKLLALEALRTAWPCK